MPSSTSSVTMVVVGGTTSATDAAVTLDGRPVDVAAAVVVVVAVVAVADVVVVGLVALLAVAVLVEVPEVGAGGDGCES